MPWFILFLNTLECLRRYKLWQMFRVTFSLKILVEAVCTNQNPIKVTDVAIIPKLHPQVCRNKPLWACEVAKCLAIHNYYITLMDLFHNTEPGNVQPHNNFLFNINSNHVKWVSHWSPTTTSFNINSIWFSPLLLLQLALEFLLQALKIRRVR